MKLTTITFTTVLTAIVSGQSLSFNIPASNIEGRADANGLVYQGDGAGGPGRTADTTLGGIEILINERNGMSVSEQAIAFCVEFDTPVWLGDHTYDITTDLSSIDGGLAAGLSNTQVGQLSYLFDTYYQDSVRAEWDGTTNNNGYDQVFQFALWELTHDDDLSLSDPSGNFYTTEASTLESDAQDILDEIAGSMFDFSDYTSTEWEIYSITNENTQNLIYAKPLSHIPEPSTIMLSLIAALSFITKRKR